MKPTNGMDRGQFHDKAWTLWQAKALDDAKLPKLSIYAIRTLWDTLFDSMPFQPVEAGEPVAVVLPVSGTGATDMQGNGGVTISAVALDDERAAFEAWFRDECDKRNLGVGDEAVAQSGWQARAASPHPDDEVLPGEFGTADEMIAELHKGYQTSPLQTLLREIATLKRYDPNRNRSGSGRHIVLNVRSDLMERIDAAVAQATVQCKACNGNDGDMPCAYPEGHPNCLRNERPTAPPPAQTERALTDDASDASRYRWLRNFDSRCKDGVNINPPCEHVHASMYSHAVGTIPAARLVTGSELDRAIDAAMTAAQPASGAAHAD